MLKKLYKHEFYSLFRTLWPIYIMLAGLAIISRISFLFNTDNIFISFIQGTSTTLYVFSIFGLFIVGEVIIVVRFYKHLLSHEGRCV